MAESEHVVMFPYLGHGHFLPFLTLAKLLATKGLTVSLVTTSMNASKLQSQAAGSNIRFVSLSLPHIDGLPPGCESADALSLAECVVLLCSSHKLSVPFEEWLEHIIVEDSQKPVCIISDVFMGWTADSASRFGIPLVVFHTTGAMAASLLQYVFTNPASELISDDVDTAEIRDCSLDVNLSHYQLPMMFRTECYSPQLYRVVTTFQKNYAVAKERCAALLVNTFEGIDADYVPFLEESTGKPVWAIAPPSHNPREGVHSESECIRWLDGQKHNSVLYVSFGSRASLSEGQIKALARGIEASKQPFIWTIKDPVSTNVNSCDFLPEGFVEATRDRGMVIYGWVPQLLILYHPSTACFMSHCGWNLTLESICAGIPMVVWPMVFDQLINAKLVVEQLKSGLQICEGGDAIPNSDIVENTVKAAMAEELGKELHERSRKIKDSIKETSCKLNIEAFVCYIQGLGRDRVN